MRKLLVIYMVVIIVIAPTYIVFGSTITHNVTVVAKDAESSNSSTDYYVTVKLQDSIVKIKVAKDFYDESSIGDSITLYEKDDILSLTEENQNIVESYLAKFIHGLRTLCCILTMTIEAILAAIIWRWVGVLIH